MTETLHRIREHLDDVIAGRTPQALIWWQELSKMHPADIAQFFETIDTRSVTRLFSRLDQDKQAMVFSELGWHLKIACLAAVADADRRFLLAELPSDELTDFFDELSDEELKKYLELLTKKDRERVLSLMQFNPESAGGIMDTDVLTLMQDFTVEKSVQILQRLRPELELHRQIFVITKHNRLVGSIFLEDLLFQTPQTRLAHILHPPEITALAFEDREDVAKRMMHYDVAIIPVLSSEGMFLGIITSDTLAHVIEQEAEEDIYRMSALAPIKHAYFETSFLQLVFQRGSILLGLLLIQTLSSLIINRYQVLLAGILMNFITMLISAGGNASSQSSALLIQGLAAGELHEANIGRFIRRELYMGALLALVLSSVQFFRVWLLYGSLFAGICVALSLAVIVLVAVLFGSSMPWILKKLRLDPAHSAGPVLATLMDVVGLLLFCSISNAIVSFFGHV
jgi:magnesium transporter